jgi:hypothetical protein
VAIVAKGGADVALHGAVVAMIDILVAKGIVVAAK